MKMYLLMRHILLNVYNKVRRNYIRYQEEGAHRKRELYDRFVKLIAEHFIERGASRSSMSGQPYHVRCPGKPVAEAGDWFRGLLQRLRAAPKVAPTR